MSAQAAATHHGVEPAMDKVQEAAQGPANSLRQLEQMMAENISRIIEVLQYGFWLWCNGGSCLLQAPFSTLGRAPASIVLDVQVFPWKLYRISCAK